MSVLNMNNNQQGTPLLKVRNLSKRYAVGKRWLQAFSDINFDIKKGQCLALVGESGCGKSSIAMSVLRLVDPDMGDIEFSGTNIGELKHDQLQALRKRYGIVFQNPYSALNPRMNVFKLVEEPLVTHFSLSKSDRKMKVIEALQAVGMDENMLKRMPHELSGGQRQRIGIARALVLDPQLLVLDEPTAALDVSVQATVVNLLNELRETRGLSYLFITHDLGLVERIADQVLVMYLGKIVESGPVDLVFSSPEHHYSKALLASIPSIDPNKREQLKALQGEVPSPLNRPPGCSFHGRCSAAQAICSHTIPLLQADLPLDSHRVACHYPNKELS